MENALKNTFKKSERLTSKVSMEKIFEKGSTLKKFPLILKYSLVEFEDEQPLKVVISVPKRRIRKAHNRNRIRRQLKEAYRLNRLPLKRCLAEQSKSLALFFIYTGKENPDYAIIEEKIQLLLKELMNVYPKPSSEEMV
jgi:ribonuclease P protein component